MTALTDLEKKAPLTELEMCIVMAGTLCDKEAAAEELAKQCSDNVCLQKAVDDARKVIEDLMGVLPDNMEHDEVDVCWDRAWDELDGDAQDVVKDKRANAIVWLSVNSKEK